MSRTSLLLAGLALVLGAVALLAYGCGNEDAGHLRVSERRIDFGRILWGDLARHVLVIENRGDKDVTITHTAFNCSCFKLRPFLHTLHPGESRELEVTFVSGAVAPGPIHGKQLQIVTDDPEAGRIIVDLLGDIVPSMTFVPEPVDLGPLDRPESRKPHVLKLRPGPDMHVELLRWRVEPESALEVEKTDVEGGVDFTIRLTRDPPTTQGRFLGWLELHVRVEGPGFEPREIEHVVRIQGF